MTPRENLLNLLRKKGCEWVPCELFLCPSLEKSFHERFGTEESYQNYFSVPMRRISELVPDDDDRSRFLRFHDEKNHIQVSELDEWGIGHRATPTSMHMTQMFCPLRDVEDIEVLKEYPLPTYSLKNNEKLQGEVQALHERGLAAIGNMQCTIWETAWYIRGMEPLMMDMLGDEDLAEVIFDKITEMSLQRARLYAQAGVDFLYLGDDVGTQSRLMMREETYVEWLKPRLTKIIREAKAIKPDLMVFYHSCGYIEPIIPHLIDAGVDILNPIQPESMDFETVFKKYGDKLAFHGTIGTQSTMPFGTPEEVKAAVHKNLDIAGPTGGLLVAPTHLLEPEVPWENIIAYVEACKEHRF